MEGSHGSTCRYTFNGTQSCNEERLTKSEKGYCIFHEENLHKNSDLFVQKIRDKLRREVYDFRGYYFPQDSADLFKGIIFEKNVNFDGATFAGSACFKKSKFKGVTFFRGARFTEDTDFEECEFLGSVYFTDAAFSGETKFGNAQFKLESKFGGVQFSGKVDFTDSDFLGPLDLVGAIFSEDAEFAGATFSNIADFRGTTFKKDAEFSGATFSRAEFRKATFKRGANFSISRFTEDSGFEEIKFYGEANFGETEFKKRVRYNRVDFFDTVTFINAKFPSEITFRGGLFRGYAQILPRNYVSLNLSRTRFLSKTQIRLDAAQSYFAGADLAMIDFEDSRWPDDFVLPEEKECERKDLIEISESSKDFDISVVETIYRDLKKCMERSGNYEKAGEFYFRERECRRKRSKGLDRLWLEIYRTICGYGERPVNVIRVSLTIIFFFSAAHVLFQGICFSDTSFTQRLWESFYFSVITFTTLGYGDFHPVTHVGQVLAIAEAFTGAFMIAVFVLVFGRKMMR